MNWTAADVDKATSRAPAAPVRPVAPRPIDSPGAAVAGRGGKGKPAFAESPAGPRTYLVGAYAVAIGGRLHAEQLPDRLRIVVTGPASEELPAALVAALTQLLEKS